MTNNSIDLIVANGKIWTESPLCPEVEALAITGSTIAATGTSADMLALRNHGTQVIDLKGRRAVPGFNDAHLHFYLGGTYLASAQLREARNETEFRLCIAQFAAAHPAGEWILGGSWDPEGWPSGRLPDHWLIDDVTPDHPVFVTRLDGHTSLANALAMKIAGIDKHTQDVQGGVILRDSGGNPTGIFQDAAKALIQKASPQPDERRITESVVAAQKYAATLGVTSVQEMGMIGAHSLWPQVLSAYRCLLQSGNLQVRISAHHPLPLWQELTDPSAMKDSNGSLLRTRSMKGFADGSLGSTTAWFFEPYLDAPHSCGIASDEMLDPEVMYRNIRCADAAQLPIAIHAIGDRANRAILDFYERVSHDNGARDRRLRIEHAQHLAPADIPRFGKLGVIASMQPYHAIDDARWAEKRIGSERARYAYSFRSLLDAGATLAFGSDWFVAPMDPILGIYAAATRRSTDGKYPGGWIPEEKITVAEAVHAYTVGSAFASFEEHIKGSLEPGKLADLAVLSNDIFKIDPSKIREARVDLTVFDGRVIFARE
jgi:predicted amidohydrolase YtcJ